MKIISLVFLLSISMLTAQTIKPISDAITDSMLLDNVYYKDTNNTLANCVGTWEYNNGTDYFKVTFTLIVKELEYTNGTKKQYFDRLKAKYIYKKNGVVIYDNYGQLYLAPNTVNTKPSDLGSAFTKNSEIYFTYTEPSFVDCHRRKVGDLTIKRLTGLPGKMSWLRTTATTYFDNSYCGDIHPDNSEFLIPANMILTKIN
ncbi:DUF6705 domain-containing protein [Flavobacterium antarcticum]|uniref:DUF6705 family protein n=1 Tax=Flavobacterium antarcticum TaxID=271155 RepID=UPI00041230FD|nr:DUF6705 family protein [Flavobacterium antarcticum]